MTYKSKVLILVPVLLFSGCGDTGDSTPGTGAVSLYVTDNLENYTEVTATVNAVSLYHKGTGVSCNLFNTPQSFDFAALGTAQVMELLTVTSCPAVNYNRLLISVGDDVHLTDTDTNSYQCKFIAYKDENDKPNVLNCDANGCGMQLTGATNVVANQENEMALDFDLKSFEINLTTTPCEVTLKVSPLHIDGMAQKELDGFTRVDDM